MFIGTRVLYPEEVGFWHVDFLLSYSVLDEEMFKELKVMAEWAALALIEHKTL